MQDDIRKVHYNCKYALYPAMAQQALVHCIVNIIRCVVSMYAVIVNVEMQCK